MQAFKYDKSKYFRYQQSIHSKNNKDEAAKIAFGQVLEGMDIVKKIQEGPTEGQSLKKKIKIISISKSK